MEEFDKIEHPYGKVLEADDEIGVEWKLTVMKNY